MIGARQTGHWKDRHYLDVSNFLVLPSSATLGKLAVFGNYEITDGKSPVTVDVPVTDFYSRYGDKLKMPFDIEPGQVVTGDTPVNAELNDGEYLCLQTRSRAARMGLNVIGFNRNGIYSLALDRHDMAEMGEDGRIKVFITNEGSVPCVIDQQPRLLQLMVTQYAQKPTYVKTGDIKLFYEGKDVTEYHRLRLGNMNGYAFTLSPNFLGMEKQKGAKIRWSEGKQDAEKLMKSGSFSEIVMRPEMFPFNLSASNERVDASRPAYVFEFRLGSGYMGDITEGLVSDYKIGNLFLNLCNDILVTGNSGIIHNGSKNKTVFENSLRRLSGRARHKLGKMFSVGDEFAFMMPLSLNGKGNGEYNGNFKTQDDVRL
ncbi:MAG: hypothetical protein NTU57_02770 [Candidatus Aenigmarchaeota archaeon]|nr:hypothetical protein [Candidatus Aenigmarchaeota archaeon]